MSEDIEQLIQLRIKIASFETQLKRLESNAESEKGTIKRQREELRHEITLIENKWDEIMFTPGTGILVQVDRLMQDHEIIKKLLEQVTAQTIVIDRLVIEADGRKKFRLAVVLQGLVLGGKIIADWISRH